jgi:16S rRNA (guanine966-N2)-methyltransferase
LPIRPTSDRIRESLFNILPDIKGMRFLDLFAGTGSVGLEALSRGAAQALFVDSRRRCIESIQLQLSRFGFGDSGTCLAATAERALEGLGKRGEAFEVIFMDPPYDEGYVGRTLMQIIESRVLADDGMVAAQRSARESVDDGSGWMMRIDERRYGDSVLSFWKWR